MGDLEVKCNMCDWQGSEDELELIEEEPGNQVDRSFVKVCPNCQVDDYLMDL